MRYSGDLPDDIHDVRSRHVRDPQQSSQLSVWPLKLFLRHFLGPEIGGHTGGGVASLRDARPLNYLLDA